MLNEKIMVAAPSCKAIVNFATGVYEGKWDGVFSEIEAQSASRADGGTVFEFPKFKLALEVDQAFHRERAQADNVARFGASGSPPALQDDAKGGLCDVATNVVVLPEDTAEDTKEATLEDFRDDSPNRAVPDQPSNCGHRARNLNWSPKLDHMCGVVFVVALVESP